MLDGFNLSGIRRKQFAYHEFPLIKVNRCARFERFAVSLLDRECVVGEPEVKKVLHVFEKLHPIVHITDAPQVGG